MNEYWRKQDVLERKQINKEIDEKFRKAQLMKKYDEKLKKEKKFQKERIYEKNHEDQIKKAVEKFKKNSNKNFKKNSM